MGLIVRDDGTLVDNNVLLIDFGPGIAVGLVSGGNIQVFIGDNSIIETMIQDSAITTAKILDGAVTSAKIAANAITTGKIVDAAVTPAKLDTTYLTTVPHIPIIRNEQSGSPASTSIANGVTTVISDQLITIPNDTAYDLTLNVAAMVQGNAVANISTVYARITDSSGTTLAEQTMAQATQTFVTLVPSVSLLNRRNEQVRARLAIGASGGSISYRAWGAYFTAFPR
jgi:hypothetical protein